MAYLKSIRIAFVLSCVFSVGAQGAVNVPDLHKLSAGVGHLLALSPDGTALAYVATSADTRRASVYVKDLEKEAIVKLPEGGAASLEIYDPAGLIKPRWSNNGKKLAYFSIDAHGEARLNIWNRETGHNQVFSSKAACGTSCMMNVGLEWARDDSKVYFLALNDAVRSRLPNTYKDTARTIDERERLTLRDPAGGGVTVLSHPAQEDSTARFYSHSYYAPLDVVVADLESGHTAVLLTGLNVKRITISPDGKKLLAIALDRWSTQARQAFHDYYLLDLPARTPEQTKSVEGSVLDWAGRPIQPVLKEIKQFHAAGRASWSPDSRYIAYSEQGALADGDVFIYDTVKKTTDNLTRHIKLEPQAFEREFVDESGLPSRSFAFPAKFGQKYRSPLWTKDGSRLYLLRSGGDGASDDGDELWQIDIRKKNARRLTTVEDFVVQHIAGSEDVLSPLGNDLVLAGKFPDGDLGFALLRGGSKLETLGKFPLRARLGYGGITVTNARRGALLAFATESGTKAPEVYSFDASSRVIRQETKLNEALIGYDYGELVDISWTRTDGKPGHAKLHLPPAHARRSSLPPLVMTTYPVDVPRAPDPREFPDYREKYLPPLYDLLGKGFAVLDASIPVKSGGGACEDIAKNVELALDAVERSNRADVSRAGIMGFSFGGWTVNCVIGKTHRFKAALSGAGIANMFTIAFTPEQSVWGLGGGQTSINRSIWEAPELYLAESPVLFSDQIETPLLLVHGKADSLVDMRHAIEMFEALKNLGKRVELVLYDQGNHGYELTLPDYKRRAISWFERYLVGGE